MVKVLEVKEPIFMMDAGDRLSISEDGKEYSYSRIDKFNDIIKGGDGSVTSNHNVVISADFANTLIEEGYLKEVDDNNFVNVFTEIDNLMAKYNDQLENIDEDCAHDPACLKIEKETVLRNLVSVLDHLRSLKK